MVYITPLDGVLKTVLVHFNSASFTQTALQFEHTPGLEITWFHTVILQHKLNKMYLQYYYVMSTFKD